MATKINSVLVYVLALSFLLTYQSYVRSKFSHQQKPNSIIKNIELDCTQAIYNSHEILMNIENYLRDSELRSIHMPIM